MVKAFKERHDNVVKALNEIPGFSCISGDGAFYAYPNVTGAMEKLGIKDDVEFAEKLLTEAGVALVPGSAFGTPGFMRLSYATSMEVLEDALARIKNFLPYRLTGFCFKLNFHCQNYFLTMKSAATAL